MVGITGLRKDAGGLLGTRWDGLPCHLLLSARGMHRHSIVISQMTLAPSVFTTFPLHAANRPDERRIFVRSNTFTNWAADPATVQRSAVSIDGKAWNMFEAKVDNPGPVFIM